MTLIAERTGIRERTGAAALGDGMAILLALRRRLARRGCVARDGREMGAIGDRRRSTSRAGTIPAGITASTKSPDNVT
jgi:hypothetical protein